MTQYSQEAWAIVPARGGSKGIPSKNIVDLCGKPLIAWTLEAARRVSRVSRLFVSTDDPRIAETAVQYGAEVIRRPAEISGDTARSEDALLHVLGHFQQAGQALPSITVFLQCTSPLTDASDIEGTIRALDEQNADSAASVTDFHYFVWREERDHDAIGINHDKSTRPRRQDREPQYLETGAVYAMRTEGFLLAQHRFFGKTALHHMPRERCLEIDDPVDMQVAEMLLRNRRRQLQRAELPDDPAAVVFDFDGVMTDDRVIVFSDGYEGVVCNRADGFGISRLAGLGLKMAVISAEVNPVVEARCQKLGLRCFSGVRDKLLVLRDWLAAENVDPSCAVYLGNDYGDVTCLRYVGCGVAVADACDAAKAAARIVLTRPGGQGAVRELSDLIVEGRA